MRAPGTRLLFCSLALSFAALAACASDDEAFPTSGSNDGTGNSGAPPGTGGSIAGIPGDAGLPPEQEDESLFRVPVVSGRWVWSANPDTGRVAIIDATTYETHTVDAGLRPTYLAALAARPDGGSAALVINVGSQDANLLLADAGGVASASAPIAIHADANSWAVGPSEDFAIAWSDARTDENADPSEGFQDLTVIDLRDPALPSRRLTVGFRPTRVFMDTDDDRAYVVSEPGISVIELDGDLGPFVDRDVALSADPANDTSARDVVVTPDGQYALVRREGEATLTVVTIESGERVEVALPGAVTDLDLTADASLAVAVVRAPLGGAAGNPSGGGSGAGDGGEAGAGVGGAGGDGASASGAGDGNGSSVGDGGQASTDAGGAAGSGGGETEAETRSMVALLPVPEIATSPAAFELVSIDEVFGSVSLAPEGVRALLYSNAVSSSHLTLLDTSAGETHLEHRTVDLQLPVHALIPTPDGAHAIALLRPEVTSVRPGAFAVVPVAQVLPAKIQGTVAPTAPASPSAAAPARVAVSNDRAVVTVTNHADIHAAYLVRMPERTVDRIALASEPLPAAVGIVPDANKAFVSQRHPEGRITFIDLETGKERTMTGFELAAKVSNGK